MFSILPPIQSFRKHWFRVMTRMDSPAIVRICRTFLPSNQ